MSRFSGNADFCKVPDDFTDYWGPACTTLSGKGLTV